MRAERDNHPAQAYITRKNANFHSSGGVCAAVYAYLPGNRVQKDLKTLSIQDKIDVVGLHQAICQR